MVLVPIEAMFSSTACWLPWPSATTDTTDAMPMMMPSMVRKVRSLCATIERTRHAQRLGAAIEPLRSALPRLRSGGTRRRRGAAVLFGAACRR